MKPTSKKVIALTIGRDYSKPKLRPPLFEDATNKEVSFGRMSSILDELSTPQPIEQSVEEETPAKQSIWVSIKRFIPNSITELVTAQ